MVMGQILPIQLIPALGGCFQSLPLTAAGRFPRVADNADTSIGLQSCMFNLRWVLDSLLPQLARQPFPGEHFVLQGTPGAKL